MSGFVTTNRIRIAPEAGEIPAMVTAPVLSGDDVVGALLSCSTGVWSGVPYPDLFYQLLRDGANIGGATAATYQIVEDDLDTLITCRVRAKNAHGFVEVETNGIEITQSLVWPTSGAWLDTGVWPAAV